MTDTLWHKGTHSDHSVFVIEVSVRKDQSGMLYSRRRLQSEMDETVASTFSSGGLEAGGWALLTEAARTEATLQLLLRLTHEKDFQQILTGGTEVSSELLEKLSKDTLTQLHRGLAEAMPKIVHEVIETLRIGLKENSE